MNYVIRINGKCVNIRLFVFIYAFFTALTSFGANGSFERTAGPPQSAMAQANVVFDDPTFNSGETKSDSQDELARGEANGSSHDSLASGIAHAEFTALSPVPVGSSTFGPMVNVSSFHSGLASATFVDNEQVREVGEVLTTSQRQFNLATANSNFVLNFGGAAQGDFYGFLYLVGFENPVVDAPSSDTRAFVENNTAVTSSIAIGGNTFGVTATYRLATDDWVVSGTLPGGVIVNETSGSVNRHFSFVVPVPTNTAFTFASSNSVGAVAAAKGTLSPFPSDSDALAEIQVTTVGGAWGFATTGTPPAPADFNGDGHIDNSDYEIWRMNAGRNIGALGPQGDANLDGAVNADDLTIWLANTETPGIPGDYNGDNVVDAADYTVWSDTLGSTTNLSADGNLDGTVNSADYTVWASHFNDPPSVALGAGGIGSVPEPETKGVDHSWSIACNLHSEFEGFKNNMQNDSGLRRRLNCNPMSCKMMRLVIFPILLAFTFPSIGHSHTLWLKTAAEGGKPVALLFFGESATDEAYKLPKALADAKIWYRAAGGERKELKAAKIETEDRIALAAPLDSVKASENVPFVLETSNQYGVYGNWLLTYYTKHVECDGNDKLAACGPSKDLKFDIVPSAKENGVELAVLWDGKPKADVHVTVSIGDDKPQEFKTDEAGKVFVEKIDGDGLVAVIANFEDPSVQGELNGKKYTTGAQYATLTFPWVCPCHGDAGPPQATALSLPEGLTSFGAVVSDGWLYVYGGHTGKEHDHSMANQSQHFRRTKLGGSGVWEELKMETPVQGLALVAHGGKIYRVGGLNSHNATTDDEEDSHSIAEFAVFDPQTGQWTALAPLPDARSSHNAAVVGDKLYVVGGWTLSGPRTGKWLDYSLVYDFKNPSAGWQRLPDQSFQRRALAAGEWHGKLVAIGGMDDSQGISQEVDLFDPAAGVWSRGPELPGDGMAGFGVSAWNLDGALYVCGSEGGVYRLSDDGSKWEEAARLAKPRFFHQLVPAGDGALLAIGGAGASEEGHLTDSERIDVRSGAANHPPTPAESRAARSSEDGHAGSAAGGQ